MDAWAKEYRMLAYRRRETLLEALLDHGSLTVRQAARQLRVSEVTIRSDLRALAKQGKIRRVHGGAVLVQHQPAPKHAGRELDHFRVERLAQRAAAMIEDGESIAITAGRVSADLARALLPRRHLKVVTNSLAVAGTLAEEPTNTVIVVGGVVGPSGAVVLDGATSGSLDQLKVGRAFVPCSHLSSSAGVMVASPDRAATLRSLVALAQSTVVILDGADGAGQVLVSAIPVGAIDHAILDEHVPAQLVEDLRSGGVTISLCGARVVTMPPRAIGQATYKIAFANLSETEVFTAEVRHSIEEAARQAGNIELLLADNNYDGETALRNAEQFIAQQADLVIEYQTDDSYGYRLMHRLRLAHIPTIAIDIPLPGATYFGVDNYHASRIGGDAIAQAVMERWNGRLDYIIALGLPRSGPALAVRMQGQVDAICERVSIRPEQIVQLDSENIYDTAYRRSREALARIPVGKRLAVIAINDATVRGAIAALAETGHVANAVAVSQGADRLALEELQRPGTPLVGAVVFSPETYGQHVIPLALDILSGKEVPPALYQHHWLITSSTVREYLTAS
jgi:ribose transport system substrate-binding protein